MGKDKYGEIKQDELEKQLNKEAEGKTEVTDVGDEFEILFKESNRYYTVDKDGNISNEQIATKIEYAGDITKNNQYDGSKEKPYQISCIEDLVAYSNMAKGSGVMYQNGEIVNIKKRTPFTGKYFVLTRDLNFKSDYSYGDSKRTDFGDLNTNETIETIKEELTKTDDGCVGFTPIGYDKVVSYFDGNNYTIKNIYIHKKGGSAALFLVAGDVKNLKLTGTIINDEWGAAGIANYANSIENCVNYANITGYNFVGGICAESSVNYVKNCVNYGDIVITGSAYLYGAAGGISSQGSKTMSYCVNYGNITCKEDFIGGILGFTSKGVIIDSCKNYGRITSEKITWKGIGGIVGSFSNGEGNILNSINYGEINGANVSGGILGNCRGHAWDNKINLNILNCLNMGNVNSPVSGGIVGGQETVCNENFITIKNSYNIGKITGKQTGNIIGEIKTNSEVNTQTNIENVYYCEEPLLGKGNLTSNGATLKSQSEMKSQAFEDLLNQNIGENLDWKKWKIGKKGYPEIEY